MEIKHAEENGNWEARNGSSRRNLVNKKCNIPNHTAWYLISKPSRHVSTNIVARCILKHNVVFLLKYIHLFFDGKSVPTNLLQIIIGNIEIVNNLAMIHSLLDAAQSLRLKTLSCRKTDSYYYTIKAQACSKARDWTYAQAFPKSNE